MASDQWSEGCELRQQNLPACMSVCCLLSICLLICLSIHPSVCLSPLLQNLHYLKHGPPGFACWISYAPVFSFMYCWVLTLFCLLFVSWFVCSGGDAWVGWGGSFIRTRHLCVLVHIWAGGGVGALWPVWVLQ